MAKEFDSAGLSELAAKHLQRSRHTALTTADRKVYIDTANALEQAAAQLKTIEELLSVPDLSRRAVGEARPHIYEHGTECGSFYLDYDGIAMDSGDPCNCWISVLQAK